jgi:hypothetical protein
MSVARDHQQSSRCCCKSCGDFEDEEYGGGGSGRRGGRHHQSSLGPCADSFGININMAFWLCVAQLPIMVGLALHYPTVRIDLFSTGIRTAFDPSINQTAVVAPNQSAVGVSYYEHGVGITGLYVINAASFAFFAVMTMNFVERGGVPSDDPLRSSDTNAMAQEEFVAQNLGMVSDPMFRAWNQVCRSRIVMLSWRHLPDSSTLPAGLHHLCDSHPFCRGGNCVLPRLVGRHLHLDPAHLSLPGRDGAAPGQLRERKQQPGRQQSTAGRHCCGGFAGMCVCVCVCVLCSYDALLSN